MDWLAFWGSIIGGLIGGLFTFLGVRYTIKNEKKKARKEELKDADRNKPRLEIVNFKDISPYKNNKILDCDCNVLALKIEDVQIVNGKVEVTYDESVLDDNKLVFVEYELKNTGLTEIEEIAITSNMPRTVCVMQLERREFYISEKVINYDVWSQKRYIKQGQSFKLRIYYLENKIIKGMISYPFTIWLHDVNGRYWEQKIDGTTNLIEISFLSNRETLVNNTSIDIAEDCFKNPSLW